MTEISILGCGWLGLPLAEELIKKGYQVKGSTTSPDKIQVLKKKNIQPYLIDLSCQTCQAAIDEFLETDILLINFPPKLKNITENEYLLQIKKLLYFVRDSPVSRVLFVSSTSVYPTLNRVVTEEDSELNDPQNLPILLQAENLILDSEYWLTTIIRFGGLIGDSRHPAKYLAGKTNVPNPDAPVNLIHLQDCINIMVQLIQQDKWGEIFNACADQHPSRSEVYTGATELFKLKAPHFLPQSKTSFNCISNKKIKTELGYEFYFPDPLTMAATIKY